MVEEILRIVVRGLTLPVLCRLYLVKRSFFAVELSGLVLRLLGFLGRFLLSGIVLNFSFLSFFCLIIFRLLLLFLWLFFFLIFGLVDRLFFRRSILLFFIFRLFRALLGSTLD